MAYDRTKAGAGRFMGTALDVRRIADDLAKGGKVQNPKAYKKGRMELLRHYFEAILFVAARRLEKMTIGEEEFDEKVAKGMTEILKSCREMIQWCHEDARSKKARSVRSKANGKDANIKGAPAADQDDDGSSGVDAMDDLVGSVEK